jgi:uncharacterized membrane protein
MFVLTLLLRSRGLNAGLAILASATALTFPTVLWKSLEFTAVAFYIPSLFAALWFAERRRWVWFLVVWIMAMASRQSAITWVALPLGAFFEDLLSTGKRIKMADYLFASCAVVAGCAFYLVVGQ